MKLIIRSGINGPETNSGIILAATKLNIYINFIL